MDRIIFIIPPLEIRRLGLGEVWWLMSNEIGIWTQVSDVIFFVIGIPAPLLFLIEAACLSLG